MIGYIAQAEGSPCPTLVLDQETLPTSEEQLSEVLRESRRWLRSVGAAHVLKIALVAPSRHPIFDLDYRFVQCLPGETDRFDFRGSCGHSILAAIMVASRQGWLPRLSPSTRARVRVLNNGDQGRAGINLGSTSFFDGFGRASDGFTYQSYLQYSAGRAIVDRAGHALTIFQNPEIDSFVWTHQLSYYLPNTWLDGAIRPAFNFILPVTAYRTSFGADGKVLQDNGVGIGDLAVGPMLQFRPLLVAGRPVFSHRLEVDVVAPVGKYDPHANINQSSNYASIHPHWSITALPTARLELTVRLQYMYNLTNRRPVNTPAGLAVDTARAGQSAWLNFAASYAVVERLHLGANGYFLKQLTVDRYRLADGEHTTGSAHGDGKAQVLGIGPGLLWEVAKSDRLYANYYRQLFVRDRIESHVLNLRWMHNF